MVFGILILFIIGSVATNRDLFFEPWGYQVIYRTVGEEDVDRFVRINSGYVRSEAFLEGLPIRHGKKGQERLGEHREAIAKLELNNPGHIVLVAYEE